MVCRGHMHWACDFGRGSNSAVEALADRITTEHDPLIGRAKDLGATAVTLLALAAVGVGCIVFIPKFIALFS